MNEGDLLEIADQLYGAALDDDGGWGIALDRLAHAFGGIGLAAVNLSVRGPEMHFSPGIAHLRSAYLDDGWWQFDTMANYGKSNPVPLGTFSVYDFFPPEEIRRDMFAQDLLRPSGIGEQLGLVARPLGTDVVAFTVQRRHGLPPAAPGERRLFDLVARHMVRAASLKARLGEASAIVDSVAERLGSFDCAVVVVGSDRRVLLANAAFATVAGRGLDIKDRKLRLQRAGLQPTLDAMISEALGGTPDRGLPDTLAVPRDECLLPLLVRVSPVTSERAERHFGVPVRRSALVTILDPQHRSYPDLATVLRMVGLTAAQARVAGLIADGGSIAEVAARLGITEATVRTTLKHLCARLGLKGQADLVRLVSRVSSLGR